ncbi:MFS transporter [Celeribacter sp. ULVN23_4]
MPCPDDSVDLICVDNPAFRRLRFALFASGFTMFGLLYYVQSLLPVFSDAFGVTPPQSSLALSTTTGVMAFALLATGAVSDAVGRKAIMSASLFASAGMTLLMAFAPNWSTVLLIRTLMGVTLSGVQSVTMAYLAEEVDPKAFGGALGLFIGGSALGGMFGRMFASILADQWGWRIAVALIGCAALSAALYFRAALPGSRRFVPRAGGLKALATDARHILSDSRQLRLFFIGFVVMSGFVTTYNYITYRLVSAPFNLTQTQVGLIFSIYICGSLGAVVAGRMVARSGAAANLWRFQIVMITGLLLTLPDQLFLLVLGLAILTFGMFASHSTSSGWVSSTAQSGRALAASMYLFAYYQGGSLIGTVGGVVYAGHGWSAVVVLTAGLGGLGIIVGLTLRSQKSGINP